VPPWATLSSQKSRPTRSADHYFPAGSDLFLQGVQSEYLYTIKEGWIILFTLLQDGRR
jgi:CRP-like cAMP-binding protein